MRKCIYCNSDVEEDALFCTSCGQQLPEQKKCIKCGKVIDEDYEWCASCGTKQVIEDELIQKEVICQPRKSNKTILIIVLLSVIILAGGAFFFFHRQMLKSDNQRLMADSIAANEAYNNVERAQVETTDDGVICPEPRCGGVEVTNVVACVASHTLENQGSNSYQASNLLDGDSNNVWATHFTGNEETLTFHMNASRLYKLAFSNGYDKSEESFYNNSRAKNIKVYINGTLASQDELDGEYHAWPDWITFNKEYNDVQEVKIVISSVYKGNKWNDLCISYIGFYTKNEEI